MKIIVDKIPVEPGDCIYSCIRQEGIGFNRTKCVCRINGVSCDDTTKCSYLSPQEDNNE